MSNFGIGIGTFMEGLAKGKAAQAAANQQDFANNLATNQDNRAAASSALALKQGQQNLDQNATNFANQQQEYADNANLRDLQRKDKESTITDANETSAINTQAAKEATDAYNDAQGRSIFPVGKDAAGNPTFSVDGKLVGDADAAQRAFDAAHDNRMQTYYKVAGPKIIQDLLASGDTAGANAFIKAHQDADFAKGVDLLGRLEGAAQAGDWAGVNEHLNNILSNSGYINSANHDASATPILGPDGKATGMMVHYKNLKTGEDVTKNFTTMQDAFQTLSGLISPQAAVAHNQAVQDAASAASADAAKDQRKLANDITLANVNSANTRAENAAKTMMESPEKRAAGIRDLYKNLEDNNGFPQVQGPDGKMVDLSPDAKMAKAAELYDANLAISRQGGAGPAQSSSPRALYYPAPDGAQPVGQGAPALNARQNAATTPDDAISARSRAWWRGNGVSMPWWGQDVATPPARGVLQTAATPAAPAGAGSVSDYERRFGLENLPDAPPAPPEKLRHPLAGPAPGQGEGVDAYMARLGLGPDVTTPPPAVINNQPQGRSIEEYVKSLAPSAAAQISQQGSRRQLKVGR